MELGQPHTSGEGQRVTVHQVAHREHRDFGPAMEALGYEPEGALFGPDSRFFSKGDPDARTSHLHAYALGHPEIDRHLDLCAYLTAHPTEAERYAVLKAELAKDFRDDLLAYSRGKTPLLAELIERAGRWRCASGC